MVGARPKPETTPPPRRTVVDARPLFRPLLRELLGVLETSTPEQWAQTAVGRWSVREVAAHLLDGDVRRLSFQRDRLPLLAPERPIDSFADLTAFLNGLNAEWIAATRRIAPPLLLDLLRLTGEQLADFFESLDLSQPAFLPVAWAGAERASESWLDLGREYTERWHHQQQIREALRAPLLTQARWLSPVLRVALEALPRAYAGASPAAPLEVGLLISGDAGGEWSLRFEGGRWSLAAAAPGDPATRLMLDEDTAWRLLHKRLDIAQARARVRVEGEPAWAEPLFGALAVMA